MARLLTLLFEYKCTSSHKTHGFHFSREERVNERKTKKNTKYIGDLDEGYK
jgi:hypothetical protein